MATAVPSRCKGCGRPVDPQTCTVTQSYRIAVGDGGVTTKVPGDLWVWCRECMSQLVEAAREGEQQP